METTKQVKTKLDKIARFFDLMTLWFFGYWLYEGVISKDFKTMQLGLIILAVIALLDQMGRILEK